MDDSNSRFIEHAFSVMDKSKKTHLEALACPYDKTDQEIRKDLIFAIGNGIILMCGLESSDLFRLFKWIEDFKKEIKQVKIN